MVAGSKLLRTAMRLWRCLGAGGASAGPGHVGALGGPLRCQGGAAADLAIARPISLSCLRTSACAAVGIAVGGGCEGACGGGSDQSVAARSITGCGMARRGPLIPRGTARCRPGGL